MANSWQSLKVMPSMVSGCRRTRRPSRLRTRGRSNYRRRERACQQEAIDAACERGGERRTQSRTIILRSHSLGASRRFIFSPGLAARLIAGRRKTGGKKMGARSIWGKRSRTARQNYRGPPRLPPSAAPTRRIGPPERNRLTYSSATRTFPNSSLQEARLLLIIDRTYCGTRCPLPP